MFILCFFYDFVTHRLVSIIAKKRPSLTISICTLSAPLKEEFARLNGLDATLLMDDGHTKELVRQEMIAFGEEKRAQDYGIFSRYQKLTVLCVLMILGISFLWAYCGCLLLYRKAFASRKMLHQPSTSKIQRTEENTEIMLVSDCRRPTDLLFFREYFPRAQLLCIRVNASLEARQRRGFHFRQGVDDAESECALDEGWEGGWDFCLRNDGGNGKDDGINELDSSLDNIVARLISPDTETA
jgi:phosphomevalonate kinase